MTADSESKEKTIKATGLPIKGFSLRSRMAIVVLYVRTDWNAWAPSTEMPHCCISSATTEEGKEVQV